MFLLTLFMIVELNNKRLITKEVGINHHRILYLLPNCGPALITTHEEHLGSLFFFSLSLFFPLSAAGLRKAACTSSRKRFIALPSTVRYSTENRF